MATLTVQTHDWRAQAANQTRLAFGQALLDSIGICIFQLP